MSAPLLFDTHAHYDSRKFDADRDAVLTGTRCSPACRTGAWGWW